MIIYRFRPDMVYECEVEVPDNTIGIPPYHTFQAPPPQQEGYYAIMSGGWQLIKGEKPVWPPAIPQSELDKIQADTVRSERNAQLAACDWTQLNDISQSVATEWATYRQHLRDIPDQEGFPWSVVWPDQP